MPGNEIGSATFGLVVGLGRFKQDLSTAEREARQSGDTIGRNLGTGIDSAVTASTRTTGQRLQSVGSTLTRTLTPAAIGFAAFAGAAFNELDTAVDTLRAQTGATGAELDSMTDSVKDLGDQSTQSLSGIGEMMAQVASRTGLAGEPLERLTEQFLELDQIGMTASVESITRVFGDWGIATARQAEKMDLLFRASQATGVGIDRLAELMTTFGGPLRQLGFDFNESAALVAKFEQEGVNTELVLGSMRQSLGRMARAGEDPIETFRRITAEIAAAGTAGEANAISLELFGARAGPDMAAAIREGRFATEELWATIVNGEDTIHQAAKDSEDWADKLTMLKNKAMAVVGPFGEMGMALGGIVAGLGPMISGMGGASAAAGTMGASFVAILPWIAAFAAAILIGYLIYTHWDEIKQYFAEWWQWMRSTFTEGWDFINSYGDDAMRVMAGTATLGMSELAIAIVTHWNGIMSFVTGIPGRIAAAASGMWDGISEAFRRMLNKIIGWWNDLRFPVFHAPSVSTPLGTLGGWSIGGWDLPNITPIGGAALGGTWATSGLGWVGERGPELMNLPQGAQITPLDRVHDLVGGSAGAAIYEFSFDRRVWGRAMVSEMQAMNARGGRINIRVQPA